MRKYFLQYLLYIISLPTWLFNKMMVLSDAAKQSFSIVFIHVFLVSSHSVHYISSDACFSTVGRPKTLEINKEFWKNKYIY